MLRKHLVERWVGFAPSVYEDDRKRALHDQVKAPQNSRVRIGKFPIYRVGTGVRDLAASKFIGQEIGVPGGRLGAIFCGEHDYGVGIQVRWSRQGNKAVGADIRRGLFLVFIPEMKQPAGHPQE